MKPLKFSVYLNRRHFENRKPMTPVFPQIDNELIHIPDFHFDWLINNDNVTIS